MRLYLFTSSFPYGKGEQFLETEILYLSQKFNKIVIIPFSYGGKKQMRNIPENVEVIEPILKNKLERIYHLKYSLFLNPFFVKIFYKELKKSIQKKQIRLFLSALNIVLYALNSKSLNRIIKNVKKEDILYFYWGNGLAFLIPFLRKKLSAKIIFRVHRGDLYEYLYNDYFPLREEQIKNSNFVVSISDDGKNYLLKKYYKYRDKIVVYKLGTKSHNYINPINNTNVFKIVSCSSLIPEKRVNLIIESLKNIRDYEIEWVHFGDGPLKEKILYQSKKLPSNIHFIYKGFVKNDDILKFYKETPIDCFINVSLNEGIPVSIMEAISFGIPVIATAVGGTPEIVPSHVGVLLKRDFEPKELANIIINLKQNKIVFDREKIKSFWNENYNADKNYKKFAEFLIEDI